MGAISNVVFDEGDQNPGVQSVATSKPRCVGGSRRERAARPADRPSRLAQRWLDRLANRIPTLIETSRIAGLNGLAGAIVTQLRAVASIELADLAHDDKVKIDGNRLLVHRDYPEHLARQSGAKRRLQRCALYVAHEVAHLAQGIGDKRRVAELRAAEGEESLLHFDLEADHAAAVVVAAVLDEPLDALKRDNLRMLGAFPAGLGHSPGGSLRKARRAVAIAADRVLRDLGVITTEVPYAYVLWARGGGTAGLYVRDAFTRCRFAVNLTPQDAALFDSAARSSDRAKKLMKTLTRLVRGALDSEARPCAS